jgi:nucleoside-diphosphate-sugar epimerase
MKILVTGGAGYLGSVLVPKLLKRNYEVTVLDNFLFKQKSAENFKKFKNFNLIEGDVRDLNLLKKIANDFDFIFPLAALVGAPLCDKRPKEAKEVNEDSINYLINILSDNVGLIIPTTNSGYGIGKKDVFCTEESPLNPISIYGSTKVNAEKFVMKRKNSISLRLATVFGMSPRMRIDLLVNYFVYKAVKEKKIEIFEGDFKRNYVHIDDVAEVFLFCIDNFNKLKSNIYNFGIENANLTKTELALKIKKYVPEFQFFKNEFTQDPDKRDYIVSNKKILFTGFKFKWDIDTGIKDLVEKIKELPEGNYTNI